MSDFIKEFIDKTKPQFLKNKKYITDNDWTSIENVHTEEYGFKGKGKKSEKKEEFEVQNKAIAIIINRLKYFIKKANGEHSNPAFKRFVKETLSIIKIHTDRIDSYVNNVSISDIDSVELRKSEIDFHNTLYEKLTQIEDTLSVLNIKEDSKAANGIEFLNDIKAPLSMHHILVNIYPEIEVALRSMKIDFDSEPNNELHINNPKPPEWNIKKHYWEQDKKTLQYYVDEFKKLRDGIVIDGFFISGWMYYHMNVFVTPIPHNIYNPKSGLYESKDIITNPPLRDSDLILFENYENARKQKKLFMFIAATRRAAKTTLESSKLGHAATIGKKELLCAGGSSKDLGQISKNFKIDMLNKNPAFAVYNVSNDWKDKVELGLKNKSNKTIPLSTLNIINTDGGNNEEVLAGFTPDEFIYDEIMKGKFIEALEGLKPALKGLDGTIRCTGILSGTGSSEALSADGLKVLNDPSGNDVLDMNWELLERNVPSNCLTWEADKGRPFGTFIPGQMCVDMPKIDSNIAEYLGIDAPGLSKIKLRVTNWEEATEKIKETRKKKENNKVAHNKEVVYIPIKPTDIFMSGKVSPFPITEAKAHRDYLLESGKWDRRRDLYRDSNGNIKSELTSKQLAPFPHKGGNIDAPFLLLEDIPETRPKFGQYTAGFDDYKQDSSDSDSLATFYVFKSPTLGDPFSNKIVASIAFKPEKHSLVHEKWLLLMEAYGLDGTVFGENEDYAIKDYLDRKHLADRYLAQSLDFTKTFNIANNLKRTTGWSPSTSKKTIFKLFVDYCNEEYEVEDSEGKMITLKGVQLIDDIGLLDEIIAYTPNTNVDRITGAMGAIAYSHYLVSSYKWKENQRVPYKSKSVDNNRGQNRERNFFANKRSSSFYSRRR